MSLKSWRLLAISATVIVFGAGLLLLLSNHPGNHPKKSFEKSPIRWCRELKFLPTDRSSGDATSHTKNLTALASFPGSGNTWMRYLLQQATGIMTGSVYEDDVLQRTGFPAENVCNSSVIVVKTHAFDPKDWAPFSKAILLVRDPEKSIIAEFNRESRGHVGYASEDSYKARGGKLWQQYVSIKLEAWEATNLNWIDFFMGSVKVVFYDDIGRNLEGTLREILAFLEFPVDEELLSCTLLNQQGKFQRKKRLLSFDPYTLPMHEQIDERRQAVYKALGRLDG